MSQRKSLASLILVGIWAVSAYITSTPAAGQSARGPVADNIRRAADVADYTLQSLQLPMGLRGDHHMTVDLDGELVDIALWPHSVRAERFRVRTRGKSGRWVVVEAPAPTTYRGWVVGEPSSGIAASIRNGQITARIHRGGEAWAIQPLDEILPRANPVLHITHRAADASLPANVRCGTTGMHRMARRMMNQEDGQRGISACVGVGQFIAEVAFDADVEFYNLNGDSVAATVADIEAVLNGVNLIYESDVSITHVVTEILVQTEEPDGYTSTDPDALLDEFRAEWNANHSPGSGDPVFRDVAHLMTGKEIDDSVIGIAWGSVICSSLSTGFGYGLSESRFSANFNSRIALTAHELGHNWSAPHCNGDIDCSIMCAGLGGCSGVVTAFGSATRTSIQNYSGGRPCLDQLPPSEQDWVGGTGSWTNPANWSSGVPTPGDVVTIDNGGTAQISAAATAECVEVGNPLQGNPLGTIQQTAGLFEPGTLHVQGTGNYLMQGGVLNVGSSLVMSGSATPVFDWFGGTVQTPLWDTSSGIVNIGFDFDLRLFTNGITTGGFITGSNGWHFSELGIVNGANPWMGGGSASIGIMDVREGSTFTLNGNANLDVDRSLFVGSTIGTSSFLQAGGFLDIPASSSNQGNLFIGTEPGAVGDYQITNGTIDVRDDIQIGAFGDGAFTQSGGTIVSDQVHVGHANSLFTGESGSGEYIMNAGLMQTNFLHVGMHNVSGRFAHNNGQVWTSFLDIGSFGQLRGFGQQAIYDLVGGDIRGISPGSGELRIGFRGIGRLRQFGGDIDIFSMFVGPSVTGHWELSGGNVDTHFIYVGDSQGSFTEGYVTMTGGSIVMPEPPGGVDESSILLRNGFWTQTGGQITTQRIQTAWRWGSFGFWDISGGSIAADTLFIGEPDGFPDSGGFFTISGPNVVIEAGDLIIGSEYGGSTGELQILAADASLTVSNALDIGPLGSIIAPSGATIHLTGSNVINRSLSPTSVADLAIMTLIFEGGEGEEDLDQLEVASVDMGATLDAYEENFALGTLQIGGADIGQVQLVDDFENNATRAGGRGDGEFGDVMYVECLTVGPGSMLDLNGKTLYYQKIIVDPAATIDLNGGGLVEVPSDLQCPGDSNYDLTVNVADLLAVINTWGVSGIGIAGDVNDDQIVNVADLLEVINNWGAVCD